MTCTVVRAGTLQVGDWAAVLDDADALDEQTLLREYPDGFSPAGQGEAHVQVGGLAPRPFGTQRGRFWQVQGHVDVGDTVTVRWRRRLPNRQGTYGARHGVATLLAGWHPVFYGTRGGAAPIDYAVTLPAGAVGIVGTTPVGRNAPRTQVGRHLGSTVPVVVAPAARTVAGPGGLLWIAEDGRGHVAGHDDVSAATDAGAHRGALEALALAQAHLGQASAAVGRAPRVPPLLLVQVPLRHHLAEAFEGGVALSDRAFHLPPLLRPMLQLHRASLWREALTAQCFARLAQAATPTDLPVWTTADAVGAALRGQLADSSGGARDSAQLLGGSVATPELDALVYAPQIAFADTYLHAVDESATDARRYAAWLTGLPRGKLLWEKARDRWPVAAVNPAFVSLLATHPPSADLLGHLGRRCGPAWPEGLAPWLGPYPAVDYALGRVRAAGPGEIDVELERAWPPPEGVAPPAGGAAPSAPAALAASAGPAAPAAPAIDELTVEAVDAAGRHLRAARLGPAPLRLRAALPLRSLQLDPDRRLAERSAQAGLQPGHNNRRPGQWRLLINDVSALLSATDVALAASVDVGLRRLYDLRFDFDFAATVGPGTAAVQASASRHFGRAVTGLRLTDAASMTLSTSRLRAEPKLAKAGQQLALGLGYVRDTRLSRYLALRGYGLRAQASVAGRYHGGWRGPYGNVGAAALGLWPLGGAQALVGRVRGDWSFGPVPPQAMLRLGGRNVGARGFEMSEARGLRRAILSGEWRHVLMGDARTDVFGLLTVTRLEGALFADAVLLPVRVPARCGRWAFFDVGYGVRVLGDWLGVAPASLAIDVGLPIGRCHGALGHHRAVTVYVDFVQSFSSF